MKKSFKNRYGDVFTFTLDENQDILWEGNFKWCRFSWPNDYQEAYEAYSDDHAKGLHKEKLLTSKEFEEKVHEYDEHFKMYPLKQYQPLIKSITNEISMIDPSGGPYICRKMSLDDYGFKNYIVKDFQRIDTGYKIITQKCEYCHKAADKHKMSCPTKKIQVNL
jgi:hypothetical protein